MSKLTLILALVLGVALVMPAVAKAEVQNVKVSGDITIYGIYREDYDLITDKHTNTNDSDAYYASITRVRIDADLTDNVSATIRLLNERDWNAESTGTAASSDDTEIDLDLAYVVLKEMLYSPLTLTLGRQELRFGNNLVLGDPDTNATSADVNLTARDLSARKAFDAIRATLDFDPLTIDAVIVKITESNTGAAGNNDHDLYGVNLGYRVSDTADISAYLFVDIDEVPALTFAGDGEGTARTYEEDDTYVLGIAGNIEPNDNLTLSAEVALQFGELRDKTGDTPAGTKTKDREALAFDLAATYAFDQAYSPTLGAKYIFRSGEEAGNNGDYEAWNPLYEDQITGLIADVVLASPVTGTNGGVQNNCQIININGSIKPTEDVTLVVDYYNYTLDEHFKGGSFGAYTMTNDDDAGDEVDITLIYDYTEDVQLGLIAGIFWPGDAFAVANDDTAAQILGSVKVSF